MSNEDKKPVSSIEIAKALNSSFKEETANVQDLIMEQAKKAGVMPGRPAPQVRSAGQVGDKLNLDAALPKIPPIEINGFELPRTNIPQMDALTVVMFLLATEFSRNKRIRAVLDQIKFSFADMNGNILYPPQTEKKAKKRRNDKPK